jgi:hypothetical protein
VPGDRLEGGSGRSLLPGEWVPEGACTAGSGREEACSPRSWSPAPARGCRTPRRARRPGRLGRSRWWVPGVGSQRGGSPRTYSPGSLFPRRLLRDPLLQDPLLETRSSKTHSSRPAPPRPIALKPTAPKPGGPRALLRLSLFNGTPLPYSSGILTSPHPNQSVPRPQLLAGLSVGRGIGRRMSG